MGHVRHHAIIVTSFDGTLLATARDMAYAIDLHPTEIVTSHVNGYVSFLVPPDGSKSGWDDSDDGDIRRDKFIRWIRSKAYDDGSSPLEWCEVVYGNDDGAAGITNSGWKKESPDAP